MTQTLTIKIDLNLDKVTDTTKFTEQLTSFIESESKRWCIVSGAKILNVNKKLNTKTDVS